MLHKPPIAVVLAASLLGLILAFCFGSAPTSTLAGGDDERPPIIVSNGG